jgi:hypothetical protein
LRIDSITCEVIAKDRIVIDSRRIVTMECVMRFASYLVSAALLIVGLIHLLPLSGVLGNERLAALYGIAVNDNNLSILMRHRAVLFGLLGIFLVIAAFAKQFQFAAFVAGFASVVSFLWIAKSTAEYNAAIHRVVVADWVALACLVVGAIAWTYSYRTA